MKSTDKSKRQRLIAESKKFIHAEDDNPIIKIKDLDTGVQKVDVKDSSPIFYSESSHTSTDEAIYEFDENKQTGTELIKIGF